MKQMAKQKTNPVLQEIKEFQEKWEQEKEILAKKFKENFQKFFQEIFETHPKLKAFKFTAYTPYFCDGDPCEYEIHDVYDVLWDNNEDFIDKYELEGEEEKEVDEILEKINEIIFAIDQEFYKISFGDHVEIIVYPNKIKTSGYDHD